MTPQEKANALLTPLWQSVQTFEDGYFAQNGVYKEIPIRKIRLPLSGRWDVYARVLATETGYSFQVLFEDGGTQYARSVGETTFNWKPVSVTLPATEDSTLPNSLKVDENICITF